MKVYALIAAMMEMCMWTFCMGMAFRAQLSDMFSISKVKRITA